VRGVRRVDQLNRDSNAGLRMADPPLYYVVHLQGIADGLDRPAGVLELANRESRDNADGRGAAVVICAIVSSVNPR
jgi:hypothetical protein